MLDEINFKQLLELKNYVLIDLRTPNEFLEATIPTAINIPILSNEERTIVGTAYKKINSEHAKILGMDFVGNNLSSIYKNIKETSSGKKIVLFCARGGLRSRVTAATFSAFALPIIRLTDGYKGYRKFIIDNLPNIMKEIKFITLYGKTGTGKTNILKSLEKKGADVLDLEHYANHRGSILGGIGLGGCNNQKQFEGLVFNNLWNRKSNIVFTEGESKRIGNVIMPTYLYDAVHSGDKILIDVNIEQRVRNIKTDYLMSGIDKFEIINTIERLSKYISREKIELFKNNIEQENYDIVIEELMINYYDIVYKSRDDYAYNFYNNDNDDTADKLLKGFYDKELL